MTTSSVQNNGQIHAELSVDVFSHILSFLDIEDLARSESMCTAWNRFIARTDPQGVDIQWKIQCQNQLGLSPETNPDPYLPEGPSYKERLKLVFANILGKRVYEHYIGKVGPVPRIPAGISLKKWNEPDPCDPTKRIGTAYVWMYCPSHIEIDGSGFSLDKTDDPNDRQAPKLIQNKEWLVRRVLRKIGLVAQSQNTALKVPVTINNLAELFKRPKTGNPSGYEYIWDRIVEHHGNERIQAGWICMRRDVIGRSLPFAEQQALATSHGVVLSELLPRILFNFTQHVRSQKVGDYPDGKNPWTYARTATFERDSEGTDWPLGCGAGGPSGLIVCNFIGSDYVGVAVALPAEVQAIGP